MLNRWILDCSIDGVNIDFDCIIESKNEPDFWRCYTMAVDHGCPFFTVNRLNERTAAELLAPLM